MAWRLVLAQVEHMFFVGSSPTTPTTFFQDVKVYASVSLKHWDLGQYEMEEQIGK